MTTASEIVSLFYESTDESFKQKPEFVVERKPVYKIDNSYIVPFKLFDDDMQSALTKLKKFDASKFDDKNVKIDLSKDYMFRRGQQYFENKLQLYFNRNKKFSELSNDEVAKVKQARKHLDDAIANINMKTTLNLSLEHGKPLVSHAIGYWEYNVVKVDGKNPKDIQVGISSGGVVSVASRSHHEGTIIDNVKLIEQALMKEIDSKF